jgi:hypothetical protein
MTRATAPPTSDPSLKRGSLTFALLLVITACGGDFAEAPSGTDLSGLWHEIQNYPDSGTLRFQATDGAWTGTYVTVGTAQGEQYDFRIGETVIRGRVIDGVFMGEVLVKYPPWLKQQCPDADEEWTEIRMRFRPGLAEMTGGWRQTSIDPEEDCERFDHGTQTYTLRRADRGS